MTVLITGKGPGLFSSGMHDFILRDLELGERVAMAQDAEDCGFGPFERREVG